MNIAPNSKTACVCDSSAYELSLSIVPDISFKLPAGTLYEIPARCGLDAFTFVFSLKFDTKVKFRRVT